MYIIAKRSHDLSLTQSHYTIRKYVFGHMYCVVLQIGSIQQITWYHTSELITHYNHSIVVALIVNVIPLFCWPRKVRYAMSPACLNMSVETSTQTIGQFAALHCLCGQLTTLYQPFDHSIVQTIFKDYESEALITAQLHPSIINSQFLLFLTIL